MGGTFNLMDDYVVRAGKQLGAAMDWDIMDMMKGYPVEFKYRRTGNPYDADKRFKNWRAAQQWMDNHLQERDKFIEKSAHNRESMRDEK